MAIRYLNRERPEKQFLAPRLVRRVLAAEESYKPRRSPDRSGKATGSDEARAMPTYPAVAGIESARARVRELHGRAAEVLETHGWGSGPLAALADWLLTRRH